MKRYLGISLTCFCGVMLAASIAFAKPADQSHVWSAEETEVDVVGNVDGAAPPWSIAAQGTIWIGDWSFDDIGCPGYPVPGWVRSDFRILNDGNVYWEVSTTHNGTGNISGNSAACTNHDLCWVFQDGYDNDWHQGICIRYVGDSYLSFSWLVDSEAGFDFLQVETDSACSSFDQVDYDVEPAGAASSYRDVVFSSSGFDTTTAQSDSLFLDGYGTADTHCVYIAFFADGAYSNADGLQPTVLNAATVIDNIVLEGALPTSEDFDGGSSGDGYVFVNMQDDTPFGTWWRTYQAISDNDLCTENDTCAWLGTDHTTPTVANVAAQAYGPNSYVMKNWLDDIVIGPWVSLSSTQGASGTVLSIRRFSGNSFTFSRMVQNWSVRGRVKVSNTDTPALGDSIDCVSGWGHSFSWNSLGAWVWGTYQWNMESHFDGNSRDIQMRFRNSDWQWIAGAGPPAPFEPGPGPFLDRVRIGRRILSGPVINEGIDARYQGQDCAPTAFENGPQPGPQYHMESAIGPDLFGTAAFSRANDLGINKATPNLILGDSITIQVTDVRGANGIASVEVHGIIVRGPHAGKAPSPWTIGANGFFVVPADTAYNQNGQPSQNGLWAVDLDDTYFRGGDELRYYWAATDNLGGFTSNPVGLNAPATSLADAEAQTLGIFEVSYIPAVEWDPGYLARIAADQYGDLEPTEAELANSRQKNCILYWQHYNSRRRSGDLNRTTFMYVLDNLGYRGCYDVFDCTGMGNTNNHLGSRMTIGQARNYSLIVFDTGNTTPGRPILPQGIGVDLDAEKIDMDTWFTQWLQAPNQGIDIPCHTLWALGSNWVEEKVAAGAALYPQMQVGMAAPDQQQSATPDVIGVGNHTFPCPLGCTFVGDFNYSLAGGCPTIRDYDALLPLGAASETHTYGPGNGLPGAPPGGGLGAIVMSSDLTFNSNAISQSHPYFDIRDQFGTSPTSPEAKAKLMDRILKCVLPLDCQKPLDPTDTGDDNVVPIDRVPARTALHQNVPNPFNPTTKIDFDLARDSHVSLKVYDVAGRLVRTLVNEKLTAGPHNAVWNGLDNSNTRVASGVYFYRMVAGDYTQTMKMVLMK